MNKCIRILIDLLIKAEEIDRVSYPCICRVGKSLIESELIRGITF